MLVEQLCKHVQYAESAQLPQLLSVLAVLVDRQQQLISLPHAAVEVRSTLFSVSTPELAMLHMAFAWCASGLAGSVIGSVPLQNCLRACYAAPDHQRTVAT